MRVSAGSAHFPYRALPPALLDAAIPPPIGLRAHLGGDNLMPLIRDIAAGHTEAFAALHKATVTRLKAISRAVLCSPQDAEEIVGDVFLYVWTNADRYDECRGSVIAWLAVITRNRSIDRIRSRRWVVALGDAAISSASMTWKHPMDAPDQTVDKWQQIYQLQSLLATLSPMRRQLISLAFLRDLPHEEIARVVDLPLGTVKSHIRRTLIGLRARLQQKGPAIGASC